MTRVAIQGHVTDARTLAMFTALEVVSPVSLTVTQGSYNTSVSASAKTHWGGGALDISARGHSLALSRQIEGLTRKIGFAGFFRPESSSWHAHYHLIAKGCPDLHPQASAQVIDYQAGRNGLVGNGDDTGTRAWVSWTWEQYKRTYPDLLEPGMSAADVQKILDRIDLVSAHSDLNAAQNRRTLRGEVATLLEHYSSGQTEQLTTYIRQTDAANDLEVAGLKEALAAAQAKLNEVDAEVDALAVAVPKA